MNNSPMDAPVTRCEMLKREIHGLERALSMFALVGVLDMDINHISVMQEEIARKTREALMAYWLSLKEGELPQGIY